MARKRHTAPPLGVPTPTPANEQAERIFTLSELAARWRVSRHTIAAAIRTGRLHGFKVGERVYRVAESEVLRYERTAFGAAS